jgi:hypothetical protein
MASIMVYSLEIKEPHKLSALELPPMNFDDIGNYFFEDGLGEGMEDFCSMFLDRLTKFVRESNRLIGFFEEPTWPPKAGPLFP